MAVQTTNHWKLGLFVLLGVMVAFGSIVWLSATDFGAGKILAVTYFDEPVQGLTVGSPVTFRGVPIGSVKRIAVAPDLRHVEVVSEIRLERLAGLGLPDRSPPPEGGRASGAELRMQIGNQGVTGVKYVLLDFFPPERFPEKPLPFAPPENYIPSAPSTVKSLEEALLVLSNALPNLIDQGTSALDQASQTLMALRDTLEPMADEGGPVVGVLRQIESTGATLEEALREARLGDTTRSVRRAAQSVAGLADDGSEVTDELRDDLVALRETLDAIRALASYLERDPGALLRGRGGEPR